MKELSIEEKAKRYNEAIKVAENIHKFSSDPAEIKRMEQIFPELKESKDERIRKWLIYYFKEVCDNVSEKEKKSVLDWIEKQGENANFFNKIQIGDKVTRNRDGVLVNLSQLNRVAKPAERQGENSIGISEFLEKQGEQKPACSEEQHEKESLSDIENRIINFAMQFHDNRMKPEAEWEDELKMLRDNIKLDTWSEEDEVKINRIVACLENLNVADNDILLKDVDWLKSLKGKIQPQPKQEWSEEDEDRLQSCLNILQAKGIMGVTETINTKWLKSLKERCTWKPSDEHYELEEFAKIVRGNLTGISKTVQELFEAKYLQLTGNKMYRGFKD